MKEGLICKFNPVNMVKISAEECAEILELSARLLTHDMGESMRDCLPLCAEAENLKRKLVDIGLLKFEVVTPKGRH